MACLCRHDLPLFLKQFYAFALLDALLSELPGQLDVLAFCMISHAKFICSLLKWDFIPEWEGRIEFGVSVFHAYGHQWTCQLWYHPRKSEKWGLSDGEGCERFWSQLKRLIPGLRVTVTVGQWLKDQGEYSEETDS
ncbi:hypothetical protein BS47DRAFT_1372845 [Hydnum rufescens UP504]|uniref:Uncharacterized protein n=1 Tax=Hydnum rufescens UP504 TaxID=1448309 RepID=A0A9P6DW08_9AGAM|nr:hypothetical protein BS47DRAFT_1372845 [Hydnum rufescens UP504]